MAKPDQKLTVPLIFKVINEYAKDLQWSIHCMDAAGDLGEYLWMKIDYSIEHNIYGYETTWGELIWMSDRLYAVSDFVLIACDRYEKMEYIATTSKSFDEAKERYDMVVDIDDTRLYKIYCIDKKKEQKYNKLLAPLPRHVDQ